jgi:hypothetical protein
MPFDAELPLRSVTIAFAPQAAVVAEPDLELAHEDPARLLAMLYVSPRPCAALDALLGLRA